jgi:hypothetical protein
MVDNPRNGTTLVGDSSPRLNRNGDPRRLLRGCRDQGVGALLVWMAVFVLQGLPGPDGEIPLASDADDVVLSGCARGTTVP